MNSKSYESFCSIWILFFLFAFLFVGIFIYSFSTSNIRKYQMITGLVSSRNQVMVFVSNEQLKWLYHNQILLINGKKVKFSVDRKLIIDKKKYQVFLSISTKGYSINSSISRLRTPAPIKSKCDSGLTLTSSEKTDMINL